MKRITLAILASLLLCSCYKTEYGPVQSEPGMVKQLTYVPSGHGSGSGVGFSAGGNVVMTTNSVHIPARYGIVFECQHGTFAVEGHEKLWKQFREGQEVTIRYRVEYRVTDDGRYAHDLDFLGAVGR